MNKKSKKKYKNIGIVLICFQFILYLGQLVSCNGCSFSNFIGINYGIFWFIGRNIFAIIGVILICKYYFSNKKTKNS